MQIYNTLSRKKEEFIPIDKDEVKIYACGPTVYNYIHIGNARPICVFDVLRRYLEKIGYKVKFIQNFTDIDDKIINKALEENSDYKTVSNKYIEEYKIDAKGLNVREASFHPKATENIDQILKMIDNLIEKGCAYKGKKGDVYFRMSSFDEYGKLSHQSIDDLQSGARVEKDDDKENPLDFVLWKTAKEGEPFWNSPWGKGRPGWHIECSAMAGKYLDKTIDIHCGGQDLIFPHHENEIAQSEACNGIVFARYWIHNGYINIDSRKMSKSLGNFFTVREAAGIYGYEPIRYLMISSHYRSPINYSEEIIQQCKASLDRLYNFRECLKFALDNYENNIKDDNNIKYTIDEYRNNFYKAMDDDLNTADALGEIFKLVKFINIKLQDKNLMSLNLINHTLDVFNELVSILGILYNDTIESKNDSEIKELINLREKARKSKNWSQADKIRDILKSKNIIIEDTPNGVKWHIKK